MGFIEQARELTLLFPGIQWIIFNDMGFDDCPVLRAKLPSGGTYQYPFHEYYGDVPSNVVGEVARNLVNTFLEGDIE